MTTETPAPVDEQPTPEPQATEPEAPAEETKPDKEAAKYRRQLRETETERDALAGRLEALQRQSVEQLAARALAKPEALWASGVDLASLLTETGAVDHDKVGAAVKDAIERLGLARAQRYPTTPRFSPETGGAANNWRKAFAPKTTQ